MGDSTSMALYLQRGGAYTSSIFYCRRRWWELAAEVGGVYRRWGQAERERQRIKEERKYKRGRGKREIREIEKIEKNNDEKKDRDDEE